MIVLSIRLLGERTPENRVESLAATLLAYLPALRAGFVWDDDGFVTKPELRSLAGLWRIWTDLSSTEQWYPMLHGFFWVQHKLWGDAPLPYHLVNILLHALAACLLEKKRAAN